ncbi:PLP-dependent aminotransferase family protein [Luteipulveratus mongoliensis]|uniref:aminotransferase-like domain-containing protein n=1 Tax=Luteipulveratus mongoliensis TaxID=571913 RepID=UPI000A654D56|nr:PLP-dependent aminotransferase family protein [Luteipulveratus mongoliensis]
MDRYRDAAQLSDALGEWMSGTAPLFRRLADGVAALVGQGRLVAGDTLPAERALATALAVSRSTVVAAYDDLRSRGLIESRRGSGSRVAGSAAAGTTVRDRRVDGGHGASIFQRIVAGPSDDISMIYAVDPAAPELAETLQQVVDEDLPLLLDDLGYHPRGLLVLRERVAAHLTRTGLPTTSDQVVITTGAHQAISLIAQMYVRPGATVVVESPSWPGCFDLFDAASAAVVGVPMDEDGIAIPPLAAALKRHQPALLFVMPTFHNPTGHLMSVSRRRQVADLARRYDVPLVEDNAYGSAPGIRDLPAPVAAHAHGDQQVLTVGSLSKAVWGGLRIGWIRTSAPIAERLSRHKALADLGSPILDQAIAARLMPRLPELLARRSEEGAARLRAMEDLLHDRLPDWRWDTPAGGSALWIELPDTDARVFAQVARRHGVEVVAGRAMDPTGAHDAYLRLPFTYSQERMTQAVDRLAAAWTELRRHGPGPTGDARPVI